MPDVPPKSLKLDLKSTGLTFEGTSDTKKTTYFLDIDFFAEIDVENSKTHHTPANVQLILRKKDLKEEYWPRLLKDKAKVHFLRTDFDKVSSRSFGRPIDGSNARSGSMRTSRTKLRRMTT